ncbi:MAG: hypothetical protein ACI80V_001319 [Rhodothermales bacterium]|jgi:hypothetical protein
MKTSILVLAAACLVTGCDTTEPSIHVAEPVVEAYLIAGENLPDVRLTWTRDINTPFYPFGVGISGATVTISLLDPAGAVVLPCEYTELFGLYRPLSCNGREHRVVEAGRDYRLEARLSDGTLVTSLTHVPGAFQLVGQSDTELVYQSPEEFSAVITPSSYPGRRAIFVFSVVGNDVSVENLTPFYLLDLYDAKPGDDLSEFDPDELEAVRVNSSPPLNEANYQTEADGTFRVWMPWFAVAFYGETSVGIIAIDDNLDQYLRFQAAQQGGSLAPGEIPNIIDSVDGGRGLFASMTRVVAQVKVLR